MSKDKDQKKLERRRRLQRTVNINRNNVAKIRFRLDVLVNGKWKIGMMGFKSEGEVGLYVESIEKLRSTTEIVPGRVIEIGTGKLAREIAPSRPSSVGVLPGGEFVKPALAR